MAEYFISFSYKKEYDEGPTQFGWTTFNSCLLENGSICGEDDIMEIAGDIQMRRNINNVTVLNWQRFEKPNVQKQED